MIKLILAFIFLISTHATVRATEIEFANFDEFISTIPEAKLLPVHGSGRLNGADTTFHVQLVQLGDYRSQKIFVFRVADNGKYVLVDQSKVMTDMGGSGNWTLRAVEFRKRSMYFTFGYVWHSCSGQSTNQFRFVDDRLAMIGNESEEENIEKALSITSSTNLLSGKGYWIENRNGRKKKTVDDTVKGARPLSEFDGEGWISPYNKNSPAC